jgi:hypothetical protein
VFLSQSVAFHSRCGYLWSHTDRSFFSHPVVIKGVSKCCLAVNGESLEAAADPAAEGWIQDPNLLEALAQQDAADQTILMHEAARRRRQMLARTGQAEDDDATDSQESYDSELEDERLLLEYDLEYDIGGGGPEDGIEDD